MCNCKMCDWIKGLLGKKSSDHGNCCCGEHKEEEIVTPVDPVIELEEKEETVA